MVGIFYLRHHLEFLETGHRPGRHAILACRPGRQHPFQPARLSTSLRTLLPILLLLSMSRRDICLCDGRRRPSPTFHRCGPREKRLLSLKIPHARKYSRQLTETAFPHFRLRIIVWVGVPAKEPTTWIQLSAIPQVLKAPGTMVLVANPTKDHRPHKFLRSGTTHLFHKIWR